MRWLFVTGIALDISGALLVIGAVLLSRSADLGEEAMTVLGFSSARIHASANERAFGWAGACLLVLGFVLQLIGYAWSFDIWLLGYAVAVIAAATVAGALIARRLSLRFAASADAAALRIEEEADPRAGLRD